MIIPEIRTRVVEWRGTTRSGTVYFGNVRTMDESLFRVKNDDDFDTSMLLNVQASQLETR